MALAQEMVEVQLMLLIVSQRGLRPPAAMAARHGQPGQPQAVGPLGASHENTGGSTGTSIQYPHGDRNEVSRGPVSFRL